MKYKIKIVFILLNYLLILTGCIGLPTPESTIKPPQTQKELTDIDLLISKFIPKDMIVLPPENMINEGGIQYTDIDGDQDVEIVVFYGFEYMNECKGVFILNKVGDIWENIWEQNFSVLSYMTSCHIIDLNQDGIKEIILHLSMENKLNVINIYSFKDKPKMLYKIYGNKVEILHTNNNKYNPLLLAVWDLQYPYSQENYSINVIRWDDNGFVSAIEDNQDYFEPLIDDYRSNRNRNKNFPLCEYYLIDILLKANHIEMAYSTVEHYLSNENLSNYLRAIGLISKAKILMKFNRYKEALDLLKYIPINDKSNIYKIDDKIELCLILSKLYYRTNDYDKAEDMLTQAQSLTSNFTSTDYRYSLWLNAIENQKRIK